MHQSVLLQESIQGLAIKADGIYVDCTFGRGGHTEKILQHLSSDGRLIAIDKDKAAIDAGKKRFGDDARVQFFHGSFARLEEFTRQTDLFGKVNGILLDLGVSSPQLDEAARGFSFMQEGPLDMRMDQTQTLNAADYINEASVEDLSRVFKEYGEERFAGRIARAIVVARQSALISSTTKLAEIVKAANPRWEKHKHPATRVFQAIRLHVNQELQDLNVCLEAAFNALTHHGRLAVISFHSLEDRIVKQFMRMKEEGHRLPPEIPIKAQTLKSPFKRIGKAIKPTDEEITTNIRARSAVLRVGEKIE